MSPAVPPSWHEIPPLVAGGQRRRTDDPASVPDRSWTRRGSTGLCVLTFHRVVEWCERDHDITWRSFLALLDAIALQGPMIETQLSSPEPLRQRALALSFDDGTKDHLRVGEELTRRAMWGIFFVSGGLIDAPGYLTLRHVRDLHALGHVIASHGMSHRPLDMGLSREELDREVGASRRVLEGAIGAPVRYFAPPGGRADRRVLSLLSVSGYAASRSMHWGVYRSLRDRWRIPCVPVTEYVIARGWVADVLRTHTLPTAMRVMWNLKRCVPQSMHFHIRSFLHASFRGVAR